MITTNDDRLAQNLRLWRNHGLKTREEVEFFAANSRLDTFDAAIANYTLSFVDKLLEKRKKTLFYMTSFLKNLNRMFICQTGS